LICELLDDLPAAPPCIFPQFGELHLRILIVEGADSGVKRLRLWDDRILAGLAHVHAEVALASFDLWQQWQIMFGWLREITANLPDRSRLARWRLSGSREHCREQRN
jgi:hypothetical protein